MEQAALPGIADKSVFEQGYKAGYVAAMCDAGMGPDLAPGWFETAYSWFIRYVSRQGGGRDIRIEEVREKSLGSVAVPPHAQAWGGVVSVALKRKVIFKKDTGTYWLNEPILCTTKQFELFP